MKKNIACLLTLFGIFSPAWAQQANYAGYAPGNAYVTLNAGTTSSNVALPTIPGLGTPYPTIVVKNVGTNVEYVVLGGSSVSVPGVSGNPAQPAGDPIGPGESVVFYTNPGGSSNPTGNTYLAAKVASGVSSPLLISGGYGVPNGWSYGGGVAGMASAVTQSGAWSMSITGSLPAFAATPTFNIGTIPNVVLGSGSNVIGGTTLPYYEGSSVSGGTAATRPILTGCIYNSTPISLTNGQQSGCQSDVNGDTKVLNGLLSNNSQPSAGTSGNPVSAWGDVYGRTHIKQAGGMIPLGYCQLSVSTATAVSTCTGGIPAGTLKTQICSSTAIRYRDDGTSPTASIGMPAQALSCFAYDGTISTVQIIPQSGTSVVDISFYK